jgi:predicted MFS family arabinose efflux permease
MRSLKRRLGDPGRTRVVVLLACVLALESADLATVGAAAPQLQAAFHISNAQLGLLAAISTFVGAVATVPIGALTDRVRRVSLLAVAVSLWAVAMGACAVAQTYVWLLLARLALGAVTATAGPAIASLTGDFFPAAERGKIYGYILSGELVGAGIGFVVSGSVAAAVSWRAAFAILALPAAALVLAIWRGLPEPARGGQGRQARRQPQPAGVARREVESQQVAPAPERVLDRDPGTLPLGQAIRYVLRIPTNRWLIAAASVAYFFFAGMRTFALVFVRGHLGLGQSAATAVLFLAGVGSLVGVLVSGRLADRLIRGGRLDGRVLVGALGYLAASAFLAPALLLASLPLVLPLLVVSSAALAAPNPPLDAARLDIVPAGLWGRAEGVRTLLRQSAQAAAPLLFGLLADALGGADTGGARQHVSPATARALQETFLIMLVPLALNGLMLLVARRRYPADVAAAIASERSPMGAGDDSPQRVRSRAGRRRGRSSAASPTAGSAGYCALTDPSDCVSACRRSATPRDRLVRLRCRSEPAAGHACSGRACIRARSMQTRAGRTGPAAACQALEYVES